MITKYQVSSLIEEIQYIEGQKHNRVTCHIQADQIVFLAYYANSLHKSHTIITKWLHSEYKIAHAFICWSDDHKRIQFADKNNPKELWNSSKNLQPF
jgi:hypothetical protein